MTELESGEEQEVEVNPPTEAEDADLVALLRAGRRKERFWLPVGGGAVSDSFFIELQQWTAEQKDRYLTAGTSYESDVRRGPKTKLSNTVSTKVDAVESYRVMVETAVVGYHLFHNGREVEYRGTSGDWAVFRELPPAVADWIKKTIREFQGIETTEDEGEA